MKGVQLSARQRRIAIWSSAAAAAAAAMLIMVARPRADDLGGRLQRATASSALRPVQGRLAGFAWQRPGGARRLGSATAAPSAHVRSAATEVIDQAAADRSERGARAKALAYLLTDRLDAAASILLATAKESKDAAIWNDLAVVRDELATRNGHPAQLPLALAAVDRALRLAPDLAEA